MQNKIKYELKNIFGGDGAVRKTNQYNIIQIKAVQDKTNQDKKNFRRN